MMLAFPPCPDHEVGGVATSPSASTSLVTGVPSSAGLFGAERGDLLVAGLGARLVRFFLAPGTFSMSTSWVAAAAACAVGGADVGGGMDEGEVMGGEGVELAHVGGAGTGNEAVDDEAAAGGDVRVGSGGGGIPSFRAFLLMDGGTNVCMAYAACSWEDSGVGGINPMAGVGPWT